MIIKFKGGNKIEFKQFGDIWLAESVIWRSTELQVKNLYEVKAKVAEWFEKNAPKEAINKFKARLPLWKEIKDLPFKDQVAYEERNKSEITDYLLGDRDEIFPLYCHVGSSFDGSFYCYTGGDWDISFAVRLCLEEKQ